MTYAEIKTANDEALGERFRSLIGACNEACMAYDHARTDEIHREFYAIEAELQRRSRGRGSTPYFRYAPKRRTGKPRRAPIS
jgi:hypothetical protein